MTVFVVVREDQSHYGYIDSSVLGVFVDGTVARDAVIRESERCRAQGLLVEDDHTDGEWQVSFAVQEHSIR